MNRPLVQMSLVTAMVALVAVSCGIPVDPQVRRVSPDARLVQLMASSTSTSTTTTTSTTTIAPPPSTTATTLPPTTLGEPQNETVSLYFVVGDRFVFERRLINIDELPGGVLGELAKGPGPDSASPFAQSALGFNDVKSVVTEAGVVTVEFDPRVRDYPAGELRGLVGQLVLTLTDLRGIGQVQFTVNGNVIDVPGGDGAFTTGALSRDSFVDLIGLTDVPELGTTIPEPGTSDPGTSDPRTSTG